MKIFDSFISSGLASDSKAAIVADYFTWQAHRHAGDFTPAEDDDVDLRTYLLTQRANGVPLATIAEQVAALELFYHWAQTEGIITQNPFVEFQISASFDAIEQAETRLQTLDGTGEVLEVERLQALSQIAALLNSAVDIWSALDGSLKLLLKVMNLQCGWVTLLAGSHLTMFAGDKPPPHGFVLATVAGLPPGLEEEDCRFLRQPPACYCQQMLLKGRLTHAVNIVECSRLRDAMLAAGDTQGLRFHASVPLVSKGRPVGIINVATADWRLLTNSDLHFLSAVSEQLVITLERAEFYEVAEARRIELEKELQIAREVQESLMARDMPAIPGFELAAAWRPAKEIAGDFYDVFRLPGGRWGILIGDVADKGAAAALYMAMVHSLILSAALREPSPASVLMDVNQTILRQAFSLVYVTAFLAVLDPKKSRLRYANAGHNPPLLRRATGEIETLMRTGSVLGMIDDQRISEATITLEPGDALVLYTDGVTEAQQPDPDDQDYGMPRLVAALAAAPRPAGELLAYLEADLNHFSTGAALQDDVTMLALTRD